MSFVILHGHFVGIDAIQAFRTLASLSAVTEEQGREIRLVLEMYARSMKQDNLDLSDEIVDELFELISKKLIRTY